MTGTESSSLSRGCQSVVDRVAVRISAVEAKDLYPLVLPRRLAQRVRASGRKRTQHKSRAGVDVERR